MAVERDVEQRRDVFPLPALHSADIARIRRACCADGDNCRAPPPVHSRRDQRLGTPTVPNQQLPSPPDPEQRPGGTVPSPDQGDRVRSVQNSGWIDGWDGRRAGGVGVDPVGRASLQGAVDAPVGLGRPVGQLDVEVGRRGEHPAGQERGFQMAVGPLDRPLGWLSATCAATTRTSAVIGSRSGGRLTRCSYAAQGKRMWLYTVLPPGRGVTPQPSASVSTRTMPYPPTAPRSSSGVITVSVGAVSSTSMVTFPVS